MAINVFELCITDPGVTHWAKDPKYFSLTVDKVNIPSLPKVMAPNTISSLVVGAILFCSDGFGCWGWFVIVSG